MHNAVSIVFMTTLAAAPVVSSTDHDAARAALLDRMAGRTAETRVVVLGPEAPEASPEGASGAARFFPPNRHVPEARPVYAVNGEAIRFHAPPGDAIRFPNVAGGLAAGPDPRSLPVEGALLPLIGEADG